MPLFEFVCNDCDNTFEDLIRSFDLIEDVICPFCGNNSARKKISTFATNSASKNGFSMTSQSIPASSCSSGST
jgi:putative FmdB family regulatory protein